MAKVKTESYTKTERIAQMLEEHGEVRITVEIILPKYAGSDRRTGRVFHSLHVFEKREVNYLRDITDLVLDRVSKHIRRNWDAEVEPLLAAEESREA